MLTFYFILQQQPEFRPPVSEVVYDLTSMIEDARLNANRSTPHNVIEDASLNANRSTLHNFL